MKTLTSALLGTTALAIMALGAATPAQARSDVGVYVNSYGFGVSYRDYCRDRWYRQRYWNYCRQFYGDDDDAYSRYPNYNNYYYDNDDWRRRRHHHDRDDWGGEGERHDRDWDDRRHHRHDGGEGDNW
jgi:hypothetical protein